MKILHLQKVVMNLMRNYNETDEQIVIEDAEGDLPDHLPTDSGDDTDENAPLFGIASTNKTTKHCF